MRKYLIFASFLCLGLVTARAQDEEQVAFDRGIDTPNSLFIPKGTIGGGLAFSYTTADAGNYADDSGFSLVTSVLGNLRGNIYNVSVAPSVSYFIKDNVSVGLRFDYGRTSGSLDSFDITLGDLVGFSVGDLHLERQSYLGSATVRYYMPIEHSRRFAIFVEGRLSGGYVQGKNYKTEDELNHGIYRDVYKASLSAVPGICVFITNSVAFEVQIGVMGINYQQVRQVENQVNRSRMETSGANFRLNPFSIKFGPTLYVMDRKHRGVKK